MASSDVVKKLPSRRTPAAGRAGRVPAALGGVRRTTLLLVLAAVVLSLGLVAGNGSREDRAASFSEIAQTDARAAAVELSRQASALTADPAGAVTARLAAELRAQAEVLADQSVLLVRPGSLRSGALPFPAADEDSTASADAYVRALSASARSSLDAAVRADSGTARLLASTGAAQQVLAARAAEAAGLDVPGRWRPVSGTAADPACAPAAAGVEAGTGASPGTPAWVSPSAAAGTAGPESSASRPAVPDEAAALQAAVNTEFGAAYAYEVAMARTASPTAAALLDEEREVHLAAGAEAVRLLPHVCLPALTPAPAFALPASFGVDPEEALTELEGAAPGVYADLSALSSGAVRTWAIGRLAELTLELHSDQGTVPAAPGVEAEPVGLPWAGRTA